VSSLEDLLARYAASHRDRRNIATHFAGIPMIVAALAIALAQVAVPVDGIDVTLAAAASVAACVYYLRLDFAFAVAMAVGLFAACAVASEAIARLGTGGSLGLALALFTGGWALQFLGHRYEGVKPAFLDDVRQLLVGPLFLAAELVFFFGGRPQLRRRIEERVGPVVARRTHSAADAARP